MRALLTPRACGLRVGQVSLPFEGFLEATCRVACLKALPTDDELVTAGDEHAGAFLLGMKEREQQRYATFLEERRAKWGAAPRQPAHRCLHHLLCLAIHTVERASAGGSTMNLELSLQGRV
jgi:hypothetical protein